MRSVACYDDLSYGAYLIDAHVTASEKAKSAALH